MGATADSPFLGAPTEVEPPRVLLKVLGAPVSSVADRCSLSSPACSLTSEQRPRAGGSQLGGRSSARGSSPSASYPACDVDCTAQRSAFPEVCFYVTAHACVPTNILHLHA